MTEAERRIQELISQSEAESFDDLLSGETNPEVFSALSSLRTQLLSWLPFRKDERVLELGGGFGPMSGIFLSRCACLHEVEPRALQAESLRRRYRKRENLQVFAGLEEVERVAGGTPVYDWIVLTEPSVFLRKRALKALLPRLQGLLKEGGVLLLYLKNRLSALYLLGGTDETVRVPFGSLPEEGAADIDITAGRTGAVGGPKDGSAAAPAGINRADGSPSDENAAAPAGLAETLFTRSEAEALASGAGLETLRIYYPLPEERFPQVICSDEYQPGLTLRDRVIPFYPFGNTLVGSERAFWDVALKEGLLPKTAPGFLTALGKPRTSRPDSIAAARTGKILGAILSGDRERTHAFRLLFLADGTVRKEAVFPEGNTALLAMHENHLALRDRGLHTVEERLDAAIEWPETAERFDLAGERPEAAGERLEMATSASLVMPARRELTLADALLKETQEGRCGRQRLLSVMEKLYREILRSSETVKPEAFSPEEEASFRSRWGDPANYRDMPVLRRGYIDLVPYNCFLTGSGEAEQLCFFDQEFVIPLCPAAYILYRALRYTWLHVPAAENVFPLSEAYRQFGINRVLPVFTEAEDAFVAGNRNRALYRALYRTAFGDPAMFRKNRERLLPARREPDGTPGNLTAEAAPDLALLHEAQEDLLRRFDRICRKHGLKYVAVHGTLLGAARHRGFIPWDNDVDLAMPRQDYEKLVRIMQRACHPPYVFQTPESDPECFYGGYGKFRTERVLVLEERDREKQVWRGAWIDIFPLDYLSGDLKAEKERFRRIVRLQRLLFARCYPLWAGFIHDARGSRVSFYYLMGKRLPHRFLTEQLQRALTACPETNTYTIRACYYPWGRNRNRFPVEDLDHIVRLPFGSLTVPAPENYRQWLESRYGAAYMELPPEEKRVMRHRIEIRKNPAYEG